MKIAVLSDIHSNCFALAAVAKELTIVNPDLVIVLGDTFGYYPWAAETYKIVYDLAPCAILGNHDKLLLDGDPPQPIPSYWELAKQNENALVVDAPEALDWLRSLTPRRELTAAGLRIVCCHGTPDDPLNGRYYPDDLQPRSWYPNSNEVLLLGHTHYPLVRKTEGGGLIANPGSVGQPRDGDLRASWGLLFPSEHRFEFRRTTYNIERVVELLHQRNWSKAAIAALRKNYYGKLNPE